jgi:hypothetical protein
VSKSTGLWLALAAVGIAGFLGVVLILGIVFIVMMRPAPATPTLSAAPPADPGMVMAEDSVPAAPGARGMPRAAADVPPGYTLVNATPSGKAMATEKAGPANVRDALEAGLDDLDDYFDDDYKVTNSVEDQRTHRAGMATFNAQYQGKPVKGMVMAQLRDKGASLLIVFAQNSISPAEWAQLTGAANNAAAGNPPVAQARQASGQTPSSPGQPAQGAPATPAAAEVALQTYSFPDGTGTVGLAPGWSTTAQSCQRGFQITGPNNQRVTVGLTLTVNTPNSQAAQLARQFPMPNSPLLIANFGEPAEVLEAIIPQLSAMQERSGGPAVRIDNVKTIKEMQPLSPNGKNSVLTYGVTHFENGRQQHYQALANVALAPLSNEAFMFWTIEVSAPDATAEQDRPVMMAMVNSWKVNNEALQRNTNQARADSKAAFEAGQAAHRDRVAAFDNYLAGQNDKSVRQARSVDDFVETIRGTRDVQDTSTGRMAPADLGSVDHIVDTLNRNDPGRYIQVPLRDQADPLPR